MLRIGSTTIDPHREPPRPTIRPYWRELRAAAPPQEDEMSTPERTGWDSVTVTQQETGGSPAGTDPSTTPAPVLADYLAECDPEQTDAEAGRTFETMQSGTLTYGEWAGEGINRTQTTHTITKVGGQITREERVLRTIRRTFSRSLSGLTVTDVFLPSEWTVATYEYAACCPTALLESTERTWVARAGVEFPAGLGGDLSGGPEDWGDLPGTYLHNETVIAQDWHAEGWLRERLETSREFSSWIVSYTGSPIGRDAGSHGRSADLRLYPVYATSVKNDTYTPIGEGMWLHRGSESDSMFVPVVEYTLGQETVTGTDFAPTARSYRRVTDQAPPTVSCGDVDPCNPAPSCEDRAVRQHAIDLKAYERQTAIFEGSRAVNPPVIIRQSLTTARSYTPRVGGLLAGPSGTGIITSVSYSGNRAPDQAPNESVTVELWSAIAS